MVMNASCSCASSRFGTGLRSGGDRSPSAIRCTAARRPSTPRDIDVDRPSESSRIAPMRGGDDRPGCGGRAAPTRATATLVGMPTLSSHGPRSTTALPYERSTLSSPVRTCVRGTSRGARRMRIGRLADVQLGVAAARQHPALLVRQRHDRAVRQRDVAEQRLQTRQVEPEAEHADERALRVAHRIRQHDRRLVGDAAGHQLADLRLAGPDHLGDVRHRRRRQPLRVATARRCL